MTRSTRLGRVVLAAGLLGSCDPPAPPAEGAPLDPLGSLLPQIPEACSPVRHCEGERCWTRICGGVYVMGDDAVSEHAPAHRVSVPTFDLMTAEITVADYAACADAGACPPVPIADPQCQLDDPALARNCLDWFAARDFCAWVGGRLPSEAEWEYAARSGGRDDVFPWGDDEPDCARAQLGCADCEEHVAPVCSHPDGDTAQGVCDLAGNAIEWVQDNWHPSYDEAPLDGSAWMEPDTDCRVLRGGGVGSCVSPAARERVCHEPEFSYAGSGARCARGR
ncbi:MAG: SUMF1/EgtB/PvdO family nonheme iron enzyme [Myxococcota bacterium]